MSVRVGGVGVDLDASFHAAPSLRAYLQRTHPRAAATGGRENWWAVGGGCCENVAEV